MERPEPLVHAVNPDVPNTSPALLCGDETRHDDQGRRLSKRRPECLRLAHIVSQRFAEESDGGDDEIRPPETLQDQVAQATADRVADEQRARKHGHRRGHTDHHCDVGAPVVGQPADDEMPYLHVLRRRLQCHP